MKVRLPIKAPSTIPSFTEVRYPMWGSVKFDGFRCLIEDGGPLLSPARKEIPNKNLRSHFKALLSHKGWVFDGEIWSPELTFQELQSCLRSESAPIHPSIGYYVFDMIELPQWEGTEQMTPYWARYHLNLMYKLVYWDHSHVYAVKQIEVHDALQAQRLFEDLVEKGHEGLMLRDPNQTYKFGRCTLNENHLLKFKGFKTSTAIIVEFLEGKTLLESAERVMSPAGTLERVHTQKSYQKSDTLGSIRVLWDSNIYFDLSLGRDFTLVHRKEMWEVWKKDPTAYKGRTVEFTYLPLGTKEKPRIAKLIRIL